MCTTFSRGGGGGGACLYLNMQPQMGDDLFFHNSEYGGPWPGGDTLGGQTSAVPVCPL